MSKLRTARRSGGAAADESERQATCSVDDESVYAGSSSSSSSGRGRSCDSSLSSSSDGYLHSVDSCCCDGRDGGRGGGAHYEELGDEWALPLRLSSDRHRLGVYPKPASGQCIQTPQSHWTTSSLLCGVSTLLAACSLSSLAVCIAVTGFSLSRIAPSPEALGAAESDFEKKDDIANGQQIYGGTERILLTPLADHRSSHMNNSAMLSQKTARYSWDCRTQAGFVECRPVRKGRSRRDDALSSLHQQDRQTATLYVLAHGIYHVSVLMTGNVWQPPSTLLRTVITRVRPKFRSINMAVAHAITGAASSSYLTAVPSNGIFSVYTAATVRLDADDELLAKVSCVEEPSCNVRVNGTTSYLTVERLD